MSCNQETVMNSWAIVIPSITRVKYGTKTTAAGYEMVYRDDNPWGFSGNADPERTHNNNMTETRAEWICDSMGSIVQDFARWLHENNYNDTLESAHFYRGHCTKPQHLRWVCNDSIIIIKTRGEKVEMPTIDGWVGAPITITAGKNKDKRTTIIKIDKTKTCSYTVIIDGEARSYRRDQFKIKNRDELRHMISNYEYNNWSMILDVDALNIPSKLGSIALPGYEEEDPKLNCTIWIDPIITQKIGDMDFEKVWTVAGHTEIHSAPSAIWKHTKRTKGAAQRA